MRENKFTKPMFGLLFVISLIVCILGLSACTGENSDGADSSEEVTEQTKIPGEADNGPVPVEELRKSVESYKRRGFIDDPIAFEEAYHVGIYGLVSGLWQALTEEERAQLYENADEDLREHIDAVAEAQKEYPAYTLDGDEDENDE